jgi:hypothetical protein
VSDDERVREQIEFYREEARQLAALGLPDMAADELVAASLGDDLIGVVDAYCPPSSSCLELASGFGRWTRPLLGVCERITAVDASHEMHTINRALNGDQRIEYVEADLFEYEPGARYDLVFAGFWLSHVPEARFASFWEMVGRALAPNASAVMIDDGILGRDGEPRFVTDDPTGADDHRRLWDGREFTIVKNAYHPPDLERRLANLGWSAVVTPLTREIYVVVARQGEVAGP